MTAFLSSSIAFYNILAQAWAEIQNFEKSEFLDEKVGYMSLGFSTVEFFLTFLFVLFSPFCCSD